jgi:RNA polymerase sigma-70 factor (ECF subfamily)
MLAHAEFHAAEDLVQDTFVKALERLPTLREAVTFGAWIMAIARHTATDHHRHRKLEPLAKEYGDGRRPDREAFAALDLIKTLPESYRETLVLRLVEGMTGPEIAARTGLTADSVRVNLCRGMKLLRGLMENKGKR